MNFIDTHTHLDGEEFREDLPEVVKRAQEAGVSKVFVPAIDLPSDRDGSLPPISRLCLSHDRPAS